MGYECFVFAWDNVDGPLGGVADLQVCCDTEEEALSRARELESEFDEVNVMDKHGNQLF